MAEDKEPETIKALSAKEIKKLARPEFAANPEKFYPTKTLARLGYSRTQCPKCHNNFWRHNPNKEFCGDSQCEGKYSFIGTGSGIGKKGKKITYSDAWEGFSRSLSSARIPCTPIKRYPVVARWRADVDFVAAGIFCFQPYCVTGELEPPANPLICPQFCLRFNDLDNIGLTGRHYSGFVMLGIQVFNKPNARKFWSEECVEFNFRWLTEELGIDPNDITFIEDVWAGGGNLGPSIEYFVNGLELGNMVFMQFKTFPDGTREELDVQVIDVGIGLERVPWLINGSPTSYVDVFPKSLEYLLSKTGLAIRNDIWEKYGPLSCLLNVDEVDDLSKTWDWIAKQIGTTQEEVKAAIEPIRDLYVVLDHTRTVLMAVEDGCLPSNTGGASNIRNVLRRVFAILHRTKWWDKLGMDGFLELFDKQREDLAQLYGKFKPYKSFSAIIKLEYERWQTTDELQKAKLTKLLKKRGGKLTLEDWIQCVTSDGLNPELVAAEAKTEIPGNLWYQIAYIQETQIKALPAVLYNTVKLPPTESLYYKDHHLYRFNSKIVAVLQNVLKGGAPSMIVLDQSSFYPTSGGQEHDTGSLEIKGVTYKVIDVVKVGHCVLHEIEPALNVDAAHLESLRGVEAVGNVDRERRAQLRNNHTATHIVYASCRKVLGPHVWQHGAKKSVESAHLDITHFKSLTHEETIAIENEANRIVHRCRKISKGFMPKDIAEKKYGFHLYQGGVVPGNELRVVDISDEDTEACCGTHCDNTAEVGTIKILKSARISDGIVRLYYVAGENALNALNDESKILNQLSSEWGVHQRDILQTASKFFDGYKRFNNLASKQAMQILSLQMRVALLDPVNKKFVLPSDQETPTLYISNLPSYVEDLKKQGKAVVFIGSNFVYGLLGNPALLDVNKDLMAGIKANEESKQKEDAEEDGDKGNKKARLVSKDSIQVKGKGGKKDKVDGVCEFTIFSVTNIESVHKQLVALGFAEQE